MIQQALEEQKYEDRFGNEWLVGAERRRGKPKAVTFTCGEFELVADLDETADHDAIGAARLKDLFCEAERILMYGDEKWYVGFRQRMGRGGRVQGGLHTRFRSETGEIRYSKGVVHFRHMAPDVLCEHLVAAQRATR